MRHCQQHWLELYIFSIYILKKTHRMGVRTPCLDLKKINLGTKEMVVLLCLESVNVNPRLSFSARCSLVLQLPLQKMQG